MYMEAVVVEEKKLSVSKADEQEEEIGGSEQRKLQPHSWRKERR